MIYETLLREAEDEQVQVIQTNLNGNLNGLYCDNVIAIGSGISTTAERACILAEELGHYHTTVGDILDQTQLDNRKQEKRARRWSYEKLVPLIKLVQAYKSGAKNRFELAEYLDVTNEFLENAIGHYKEKHGLFYRIDDKYCICFEPLWILESFENPC